MIPYLDTTRSVIISSPAGSGKTEKLARRYISLLEEGSEVERILCITFTEKAAAEMKQRILSILVRENPYLLEHIREKVPVMRISTIHAFCLKILKRFSMELGLDPSLSLMDETSAETLWTEAVYETLMAEKHSPSDLSSIIKERGLRGWGSLKRTLDAIHSKSPYPEMLLTEGFGSFPPDEDTRRLLLVYGRCLARYKNKKTEKSLLDFEDLEMRAYESLSHGPQWHNILYFFDEHTDHILVDEFQDTNTLQWNIIDKLTEEWRSGLGAKRDMGVTPTIFLVGDEKQSIYLFRGANVGIFHEADDKFREWLGEGYHYLEARENFRSMPAIVGFVNSLFSRIMAKETPAGERWITRYSPFESTRKGEGKVELVLLNAGDTTKKTREKEADVLAKTIKDVHDSYMVFDGEMERPCRYSDMAVLLRRRTHLGLFEDAMRRHGVPFIVLKGIGFFEEPEVAVLRELISFLVDPSSDYSLFCLLRSPIFGIKPQAIANLARGRKSLLEKLRASRQKRFSVISGILDGWLQKTIALPLSVVLEHALLDTGAWTKFGERQRHANIKKFIAMVEDYDSQGLSPLEIREKLLRLRHATEVSKANVNAEGMDAVRIMTIHAAKGLQFPMVFLPSLDERISPASGPVAIDDSGGSLKIDIEEDSSKRKKIDSFRVQQFKESEEEKRLFYVAATRARDYLCMIGAQSGNKFTGRLGYIAEAFDISSGKDDPTLPFIITHEPEALCRGAGSSAILSPHEPPVDMPSYPDPIPYAPALLWRDVTGEESIITRGHGEGWAVKGNVMHRLLEELSIGAISEADIVHRASRLLDQAGLRESAHLDTIVSDFRKLKDSGLMDEIVLPRESSYAELPFIMEDGNTVLSGRIDRVILKDGTAMIYDYKTYPVDKSEIGLLLNKYTHQMSSYAKAAEFLFKMKSRAFLVFTHLPIVSEVK